MEQLNSNVDRIELWYNNWLQQNCACVGELTDLRLKISTTGMQPSRAAAVGRSTLGRGGRHVGGRRGGGVLGGSAGGTGRRAGCRGG
jgi:hypothetical protein